MHVCGPEVPHEGVGRIKVHEGVAALAYVTGEVLLAHVLVQLIATVHVHPAKVAARVLCADVHYQVLLAVCVQLQRKPPLCLHSDQEKSKDSTNIEELALLTRAKETCQ